jgi:hypothetical protein
MHGRRLALPFILLIVGCQPTPIVTTPASLAAPGVPTAAASSTPAQASPDVVATAEINDLVTAMASFVLGGDRDNYLALVDQSDPVFAIEHGRWADDWSGPHPVIDYVLDVVDIKVDGDTATGVLTVGWSIEGDQSDQDMRTATFTGRFTRDDLGEWRYAGEAWTSTEVPNFVIRVAPGLEQEVAGVADELPAIHDRVTSELDFDPKGTLQIKLYADGEALVANTLLSLPVIAGWNEPGEALKLVHRPDGPPLAPTIAHELTHFSLFDRAGTKRTRMPWWLDEGIASYVAATLDGSERADFRIAQVVAWAADDSLAEWADMAVFEETPVELWAYVYPQGFAMVRFVTEELGEARRNAWLAAMATEMDIDEASRAVLGRSFDALDRDFRTWLAAQR